MPQREAGGQDPRLEARTLRGSPRLVPPPPHLSPRSPAAAPAPLVGLQGGRGRSRAASRNARRMRRKWPWRRLRVSCGHRDSGRWAHSHLSNQLPSPEAITAAAPRSPGIRRFRGPPSRTPSPLLSLHGRRAPKPDRKPKQGRHSATTGARPRAETSSCLRPGDSQRAQGRYQSDGPKGVRGTGASAASSGPAGPAEHAGGCS